VSLPPDEAEGERRAPEELALASWESARKCRRLRDGEGETAPAAAAARQEEDEELALLCGVCEPLPPAEAEAARWSGEFGG